jgi:putative Mn2+ efflux pump MntP
MLLLISILIVITLSFQVFPIALGVSAKDNLKNAVLMMIILSVSQTVFFVSGYYIGEQFMHLMDNFKSMILLMSFFLIGIRMMMEVLKIRKGERTYETDNVKGMLLLAIAHSVNTFLVGLLFSLVPVNLDLMTALLFSMALIMSIGGITTKPGKLSFSFASLLYLTGGMVMIVSSVYFIFASF